jgi:ubiquinone/menaquinone biosynthesis C-methylase UbiE
LGHRCDSRVCIYCKQNLNPPFHFATTTTIPHLPFEDNAFDLVYTGSAITHIDDLADAWLLEISRVLAPGGMPYLTIHDEHTMALLDTEYEDSWFNSFLNGFEFYRNAKLWACWSLGETPIRRYFYDREYFLKYVSRIYSVVSVNESAYGYQTAVLAKK